MLDALPVDKVGKVFEEAMKWGEKNTVITVIIVAVTVIVAIAIGER